MVASTLPPILAENSLFKSVGQIFHPLFELVATVLAFIYGIVPTYAIAIILLTILIMALLTPLTIKSTKSMMAMQGAAARAPEVAAEVQGRREPRAAQPGDDAALPGTRGEPHRRLPPDVPADAGPDRALRHDQGAGQHHQQGHKVPYNSGAAAHTGQAGCDPAEAARQHPDHMDAADQRPWPDTRRAPAGLRGDAPWSLVRGAAVHTPCGHRVCRSPLHPHLFEDVPRPDSDAGGDEVVGTEPGIQAAVTPRQFGGITSPT